MRWHGESRFLEYVECCPFTHEIFCCKGCCFCLLPHTAETAVVTISIHMMRYCLLMLTMQDLHNMQLPAVIRLGLCMILGLLCTDMVVGSRLVLFATVLLQSSEVPPHAVFTTCILMVCQLAMIKVTDHQLVKGSCSSTSASLGRLHAQGPHYLYDMLHR